MPNYTNKDFYTICDLQQVVDKWWKTFAKEPELHMLTSEITLAAAGLTSIVSRQNSVNVSKTEIEEKVGKLMWQLLSLASFTGVDVAETTEREVARITHLAPKVSENIRARKYIVTHEMIQRALTPRGGITKRQLSAVGLEWPRPENWEEIILGMELAHEQYEKFITPVYLKDMAKSKKKDSKNNKTKRR